jgi:putative colanic acid biosynthesis UDP-glucose lipid carrier transferase
MSEVHTITSAAAFKRRPEVDTLGQNNLLSVFESLLSPLSIICALWAVTLYFEDSLYAPYLILAVMVFALTYPGRSRLQPTFWMVVGDILLNWFWVAGLLGITGVLTGYIKEFSSDALLAWVWFAPVVELTASVVLRTAAPALLKLQGPPQRALIVGMNEQGMALARMLKTTPLSHIEFAGFVDSREALRLDHHVDGDSSYRANSVNWLNWCAAPTHKSFICRCPWPRSRAFCSCSTSSKTPPPRFTLCPTCLSPT